MTSLRRELAQLARQVADLGGGRPCAMCTGFFGPWRTPPPSPCPTCGCPFTTGTFTLDLIHPNPTWEMDNAWCDPRGPGRRR
jgi:hypothetical protein